jgi:GTP cyclohydrolase I
MKDPLEKVGSIIIKAIGEDPQREGLVKTPQRFAGALRTILSGYERTPEDVVGEGIFASESTDPIMVLRMKFFSVCEHHLLPFFGQCSIAYVPDGKIIGLSKIPKLVDLFAARLQVQENFTHQIGSALESAIKPKGIAIMISATHLCAVMRNLQDYDSPMITSYRRGEYQSSNDLFESFCKAARHGIDSDKN